MEREQKASPTHFALWLVPNIVSCLTSQKIKKIYIQDTAKPTKKSVAAGKRGKKSGLKYSSVRASYGKAF